MGLRMWKVLLKTGGKQKWGGGQLAPQPATLASHPAEGRLYQKAVSVWKLMVSRTCSGALSSRSSMMKMRW